MSRYICPKCRCELSRLQTCPWCAKVAVRLEDCLEAAALSVLDDIRAALAHQERRGKGGQSCTASDTPFAYRALTPSDIRVLRDWAERLAAGLGVAT